MCWAIAHSFLLHPQLKNWDKWSPNAKLENTTFEIGTRNEQQNACSHIEGQGEFSTQADVHETSVNQHPPGV